MNFKKLNKLQEFFLKFKDRKAYNDYRSLRNYHGGLAQKPIIHLTESLDKEVINFKHSGHLGDIIYAIPTMYALAGEAKINLYLAVNQAISSDKKYLLGLNSLNEPLIISLKKLLSEQPKFNSIEVYNPDNQQIDYDLDLFRTFPFDYEKGSIARWYFNIFATSYNLSKPWLHVNPDESVKGKIIIARSTRYNAPDADYSFLREYNNLIFVGLPEEYELMKKAIPNIEYRKTTDFLSLARLIAGADFFIGNQSFPFALAEALKVPRILESYYRCPNVIPEGENAFEFSFQPQFEFLVKKYVTRKSFP
jgi:hypothetical protein